MRTPKFDLAEMVELLHRSEDDPVVKTFFGPWMSRIDRDEYYGWLEFRPDGVDVVFKEAAWVVTSKEVTDSKKLYIVPFHLHREGHEGYGGYSGQLPNGVALDDPESEVLRKMVSSPIRGVAAA